MRLLTNILFTSTIILTSCVSVKPKLPDADYAKTSAMITLDTRHSGGSGVILRSTPLASLILTNKHVCQLIQVGGTVTTDQGSYPVYSFRVYKRHDLCLIKVLADLHENNIVAESAPTIYESMTIAGHPALLPTMVTHGHFSSEMPIQLVVDTEKCTGDEDDEQDAFFCAMMGFKPVIQTFQAQPVTATIMAGSSGSGVFDNKGHVAGLVFAGNEGLSYGFIVPFVYVRDFLAHVEQYPEHFPDKKSEQHFFSSFFQIKSICETHREKCKGLVFQGLYND